MNAGWAQSGVEKLQIPSMPQFKAIPFRDGEFYLLDNYCVGANDRSAGTTTVWFQGKPIWIMTYGGFYEKDAILFLKKALRKTYGAHQFIGGRGPRCFEENKFVYNNRAFENDFRKFHGIETITDFNSKTRLGWHKYWGMTLF